LKISPLKTIQSDDAQSRVAQANLPIQQNAKFIRAPMPQHAQHLAHIAFRDCLPAGPVKHASNPAH
jgi:hypothetical protein